MKSIKQYIRRLYYNKYGFVGEGSLIPLRDFYKIREKQYIFIGNYCSIGPGCYINANKEGNVIIKDGCILAPNITILTRNHNYNFQLNNIPYDEKYFTADIVLEEAVWVGQNVIILPGVHVGKGAVIGAGSVVSKSVPDYAVCAGNPVKIIGFRDKDRFEYLLNKKAFVNKWREDKQYIKMKKKDTIK